MRQERRRHPRLEIPLETDLQLAAGGQEFSATMQDLSAGGAGLLTTSEIPVGTDVHQLRFEIPQGEGTEALSVEVVGRVARCEQQAGLGGEAEFLIGIQFIDITRELFDQIQQFVFQRLRSNQKDRVQIERAIAIRFDRFDDFVDEVSVNLSTSGMFIRTRDPRPPGSVFNFHFQLGEDFSLIEGRAEVVWRRRHSEGPEKPPGMGVKFLNLDVPSQRLIDRLIAQRGEAESADEQEAPPIEDAAEAVETDLPEAAEDEEATAAAVRPRVTPPDLEQAEASIVSLGEVNELRSEALQLREEQEAMRRAHERQLEELRARLEDRQAAASSGLEERLRDAEAAHKESERRRAELAGELSTLRSELDAARSEAGELRQQLGDGTLEEEIQRLGSTRDELQTAHDGLQATYDELQSTHGELQTAHDGLQSSFGELQTTHGELQTTHDGLQTTHGELQTTHGELQTTHGELQTTHGGLQATHDGLQTTHDELRATHDQLQAAHGELQAARDELRGQLEDARRESGELRNQLDERTSEDQVQRLRSEHETFHATRTRLLADLDRAHGEADELRRQLEDRTAEREIERLAGERAEMQGAQEELQAAHDALLADLGRERDEAESMRHQLADREAAETDLRSELERVQSEVDQLQQANEANVAQLQTDHSTALEAALSEARQEAAVRLDELTAEYEERSRAEAGAATEERDRLAAAAEEERDRLTAAAAEERDRLAAKAAEERDQLAAAAADERRTVSEAAAAELEGVRQELTAARERQESLEAELESTRQELDRAQTAAREEVEGAQAAARKQSERLRGELVAVEESRLTIESELQRTRAEARQASRHAEEREAALRAEAENAALAATGGMPPPTAEPRRGRRAVASIALLLVGALLGTLAVSFIEPLGSLATRLRPGGDQPVQTTERTTPGASEVAGTGVAATGTGPSSDPLSGSATALQPATSVTQSGAAGPEPTSGPAEPEPGPDPAAAEQAVRAWAAAWSEQRVDDYLASYADSFQPPDGLSREAWGATRRQRILRPRSIEVKVEAARTVELSAERVSVSFDQAYASDTFSDRVRKTLLMVWQDDAWKIAEERVIE